MLSQKCLIVHYERDKAESLLHCKHTLFIPCAENTEQGRVSRLFSGPLDLLAMYTIYRVLSEEDRRAV